MRAPGSPAPAAEVGSRADRPGLGGGVGCKGSGPNPRSRVGPGGRQAPHTPHLLFCLDGANDLGSGQWPAGSGVAFGPAPDPPDHWNGERGPFSGLCSFLMEIRDPIPREEGGGAGGQGGVRVVGLGRTGGLPRRWEASQVGARSVELKSAGPFEGAGNWQGRRGVSWLDWQASWGCWEHRLSCLLL